MTRLGWNVMVMTQYIYTLLHMKYMCICMYFTSLAWSCISLEPVLKMNRSEPGPGPVLSGLVLVLQFPEVFRTDPVLVLSKIDPRTRPDRTLKYYLPTIHRAG